MAQLMDESLDNEHSRTVLKCIMIAETRISSSSLDSAHAAAFNRFTASWVYSKVVLLGISFFENHKRHVKTIHLVFSTYSDYLCLFACCDLFLWIQVQPSSLSTEAIAQLF